MRRALLFGRASSVYSDNSKEHPTKKAEPAHGERYHDRSPYTECGSRQPPPAMDEFIYFRNEHLIPLANDAKVDNVRFIVCGDRVVDL